MVGEIKKRVRLLGPCLTEPLLTNAVQQRQGAEQNRGKQSNINSFTYGGECQEHGNGDTTSILNNSSFQYLSSDLPDCQTVRLSVHCAVEREVQVPDPAVILPATL